MVCFNTRKHTNEAILYTVDGIENAIIRRKKIEFNYFHLNEKSERVYVTASDGSGHPCEDNSIIENAMTAAGFTASDDWYVLTQEENQ